MSYLITKNKIFTKSQIRQNFLLILTAHLYEMRGTHFENHFCIQLAYLREIIIF
jgi:hypothetical protein